MRGALEQWFVEGLLKDAASEGIKSGLRYDHATLIIKEAAKSNAPVLCPDSNPSDVHGGFCFVDFIPDDGRRCFDLTARAGKLLATDYLATTETQENPKFQNTLSAAEKGLMDDPDYL